MISITSRLGASEMFTYMAREVAPVDPDLESSPKSAAAMG
jgi:hypothetical protein